MHKATKGDQGNANWKGISRSIFMIVPISDPKFHWGTPTDECKINSQISVVFLHTNDKETEKEIRETTPFTINSNNKKISWGNYPSS